MKAEHRLAGRTIWVVGASSGIGAALATELVGRGARVAISARREYELDAVAAGGMTVVPVDVTDRAALDAAAAEVHANSARSIWSSPTPGSGSRWTLPSGTATCSPATSRSTSWASTTASVPVLPEMVRAGRGQLVSVASVAGYRGIAGAEAYGATKAAQINMARGAPRCAGRTRRLRDDGVPRLRPHRAHGQEHVPNAVHHRCRRAARSICNGLDAARWRSCSRSRWPC